MPEQHRHQLVPIRPDQDTRQIARHPRWAASSLRWPGPPPRLPSTPMSVAASSA
jgi:hypothetical protein